MVLGSNVELTDRLSFSVLYFANPITLLAICQYLSKNFKVCQAGPGQSPMFCYSTTSICSGPSTMISGAP
jgi:hypothetical protein